MRDGEGSGIPDVVAFEVAPGASDTNGHRYSSRRQMSMCSNPPFKCRIYLTRVIHVNDNTVSYLTRKCRKGFKLYNNSFFISHECDKVHKIIFSETHQERYSMK